MNKLIALVIVACVLYGCSTAQTQQVQSAACLAQAVANAAGASGQAAGNLQLASAASVASVALGGLCTGLAADTPMTATPATVAPLPTAKTS